MVPACQVWQCFPDWHALLHIQQLQKKDRRILLISSGWSCHPQKLDNQPREARAHLAAATQPECLKKAIQLQAHLVSAKAKKSTKFRVQRLFIKIRE
jgi:hypothetical protein